MAVQPFFSIKEEVMNKNGYTTTAAHSVYTNGNTGIGTEKKTYKGI